MICMTFRRCVLRPGSAPWKNHQKTGACAPVGYAGLVTGGIMSASCLGCDVIYGYFHHVYLTDGRIEISVAALFMPF